MGYNLLINRVYWGYNPLILTFDPNFQRDIQDTPFAPVDAPFLRSHRSQKNVSPTKKWKYTHSMAVSGSPKRW